MDSETFSYVGNGDAMCSMMTSCCCTGWKGRRSRIGYGDVVEVAS